jgi:molybdenum cofactor cytidylyltransferase
MPAEALPAVAGVLLAAGSSSRMGSNKLLLEMGGESIVRRAARRALAAGLDPLIVVLGHQAELSGDQLRGLPCSPLINTDYEKGIASSLRTGVAGLPATVAAAVVLLADMPLVTVEMLAAIVARYRGTGCRLVISDYQGVTAPPMLYDRALFDELLAGGDGRRGRQVVKRHRDEAQVLSWPAAALADLDVPEDVERVRLQFAELI